MTLAKGMTLAMVTFQEETKGQGGLRVEGQEEEATASMTTSICRVQLREFVNISLPQHRTPPSSLLPPPPPRYLQP